MRLRVEGVFLINVISFSTGVMQPHASQLWYSFWPECTSLAPGNLSVKSFPLLAAESGHGRLLLAVVAIFIG